MPTVTLCSQPFEKLAGLTASGLGVPKLPVVTLPHPFGTRSAEEIRALADEYVDRVVSLLLHTPLAGPSGPQPSAELIGADVEVPDDLDEIQRVFRERGWTDGLPIIPPTEPRVAAMLERSPYPPEQVVGSLAPRFGQASVQRIAINGVMAGCRPEHLPALIAAVEAVADPIFNLLGVQTTTNPVGPMLMVNGPYAAEAGFHAGVGAFGPGPWANTALGRALRLLLLNVGQGHPGEADKAVHGWPGKLTFCFAENESESPWEPLHVERGFQPTESALTAVLATGTLNMVTSPCVTARGLLETIAGAMIAQGTLNVMAGGDPALALSPEDARLLARAGFSKASLKREIYQRTLIPLDRFPEEMIANYLRPRRLDWPRIESSGLVPIADSPESILLVVAGGPGRHTVFIPTFAKGQSVTKRILA